MLSEVKMLPYNKTQKCAFTSVSYSVATLICESASRVMATFSSVVYNPRTNTRGYHCVAPLELLAISQKSSICSLPGSVILFPILQKSNCYPGVNMFLDHR